MKTTVHLNNNYEKFDFGNENLDKYRHISPKRININSLWEDSSYLEKFLELYDL